MSKFDKSKLPSRHVTEGPERAPHRSYYYAMGLTEAEIHQPFVGVASCWNEAAPCNIALMRQAQSAKKGVKEAGGTPREFCTITVTDGIAMGHEGMRSSLVSREVIADSVELTMRGHCYDALVGLAGCDKSLPGMMMAMLRLNVPSVFLYGGSIMPGRFHGKDVTVVDVFEGVGQHSAGKMPESELCLTGKSRLPRRGRLRRPVHRQHHGLRGRGHRPGAALFERARRAVILERDDFALKAGRGGDGAAGKESAPARHRHPQELRECRHGGGRHRRLDQCGAASAGHGERGRHQVRPVRCRRDLQEDALYRLDEAGRQICRQGHVGSRRHADADAGAAGCAACCMATA